MYRRATSAGVFDSFCNVIYSQAIVNILFLSICVDLDLHDASPPPDPTLLRGNRFLFFTTDHPLYDAEPR